jgi:hypothetical protein
MSKLSVHMPVYNEGAPIVRTLKSVLGQTFGDFELVIHDNHSTDDTLLHCQHMANTDARIRIDRGSVNVGAVMQWRRMYCGYDAEYVGLRSANDLVAPEYFAETVKLLDSDASVGLAYSHGSSFSVDLSEANPACDEWRIDTRGLSRVDSACQVMERYTAPFSLWGVYRREVFESGRTYSFRYGGDHVFVAEAALYGAVAPVEGRLDFRSEHSVSPEVKMRQIWSNGRSQLEEHVRGIGETSYFYGVKQHFPFTDMAWGHLEMFSMARVTDVEKLELMGRCKEIFRQRFGEFLKDEATRFYDGVRRVVLGLGELERGMAVNVFFWLTKVQAENNKFRVLRLAHMEQVEEMDALTRGAMARFC